MEVCKDHKSLPPPLISIIWMGSSSSQWNCAGLLILEITLQSAQELISRINNFFFFLVIAKKKFQAELKLHCNKTAGRLLLQKRNAQSLLK